MEYKEYIQQTIRTYKDENIILKVWEGDTLRARLVPVGNYTESHGKMVMMWREANQIGFANRFEGTMEKTKYWFENVLLPNDERILFFIHLGSGIVIGHLGFATFDFENKSAEIDNVVRGVKSLGEGVMSLATQTLINWGRERLLLNDIYLRVLDDNPHAITFYEKLGFTEYSRIPLFRVESKDMIEWKPLEFKGCEPEKYFIVMKLYK